MKVDLYSQIGAYTRALTAMAHVLDVGAEFARKQGVSEAELLDWRLAPDMYTFRRQAQGVIDHTGMWTAYAANLPTPERQTSETMTLADLKAAIEARKADLAKITPEQLAGRDDVPLKGPFGEQAPTMPVGQWLVGFATPNIYFHLCMAYAILRNRGAPIGKQDYFGGGF